ncbi:putative ABC transporter [Bipolaris maydis C5]|uniref:Putative ABC transporter n=1 Tax=Cochliobolus heterostrophus (strain C5 / ATCC 48332 / race O) TaxID=701091 RepID=M2USI1_COCH5|nr:putative ABC transporter [Bipolaris maydis C5]KAJ5025521.1 putative ABC transporter [Bipolaris maydis]KAJ6207616.1 putative ABC transporter [Bipolaris maydis]KAJ6269735.1 putative ABC transporter [Bipolaris maydis]
MATTTPSHGTNSPETTNAHASEEQKYMSKVGWKVLFSFITTRHVPVVLCGLLSTTVAALTMPAFAVLYGLVFGQYTMYGAGSTDSHTLMVNMTRYCIILAGICTLNWIANSFQYSCFLTFSELQGRSARNRTFEALIKKDMAWFDTRETGTAAFLSTVQAHIRGLKLSVSSPLGEFCQAVIQSLAALGVAFYFSWKLALVVMSSIPFLYLFLTLVANRQLLRTREQSEMLQAALKNMTTAISNIEAVKSLNGEQYELHIFEKTAGLAARLYRRVANFRSMQIGIMQFFTISIFVQGFWYGKYLVGNGDGEASDILTTFWSVLMATSSLASVMPQWVVLTKGREAGANLAMLMEHNPTSDQQLESRGHIKPAQCLGTIEFSKVDFSYPSRTEESAIRDVSLFIPAGETTFVIGKSGSGKSTLGQLLVRFYHPSSGRILLDGVPLENLDVQWLRKNITLVEQHSVLFNDTIYDNIALGKTGETLHMQDILDAIRFAKMDLVVKGLPDQLNTQLGLKGDAMSGGQRQRLALARAKVRDSPVLILDESTSGLDYATRVGIYEAIREWRMGKTTIIFTHDISQIWSDDFLYLLGDGRVVQEGYRKDLEAQGGLFQTFIASYEGEEEHRFRDADDNGYTEDDTKTNRSPRYDTLSTHHKGLPDAKSFLTKEVDLGLGDVALERLPRFDTDEWKAHLPKEVGLRPDSILRVQYTSSTSKYPQPLSISNPMPERPKSPKQQRKRDHILSRLRLSLHKKNAPDKPPTSTESLSLEEILASVWPAINWRSRILIFGALICIIIHSACTPVFAWVFARLLGTFQDSASQNHNKAHNYALVILGIATADGLSKYFMFFLSDAVAQAWSLSLKREALRRILLQPREFFDKEENSTSRLTETLDHFAEEARNLPGRFACIFLAMILMVAISISWSMAISWKLALVALAMGPILFTITNCNNMISNHWEKLSSEAEDKVGEILHETFVNIRTVRCLGLESHFRKKYRHATTEAVKLGMKRALYSGSIFGLAFTGVIFVAILLYWYGALLMSRNEYTANKVMECFLILMLSVNYISSLAQYITQINISRDASTRLLRLARLPTDSHEAAGNLPIQSITDISFKNVNFTYPSRKDSRILHNLTFSIPHGSCTAIVGSSGSGKSTIASLLLKLYLPDTDPTAPTNGLWLSSQNISTVSTLSLRSRIALVPQSLTLFPGTIAQNITYGLSPSAPETSPASIRAAAHAAGLADFIDGLANGYNTLVGAGGTTLSGGQTQRLAIARALVRNPDVLILDEATSALDVSSMNVIRETVMRLVGRKRVGAASSRSSTVGPGSGGLSDYYVQSGPPGTSSVSAVGLDKGKEERKRMTVVVITHAREMMAVADHVVVMEQGRVVEQGSFYELKRKRGSALGRALRGDDQRPRHA